MTREEAIKTAYENDTHPYSISASVEMLLKGAEIGRMEAIDDACQWLKARNVLTSASLDGFRKSMEEDI